MDPAKSPPTIRKTDRLSASFFLLFIFSGIGLLGGCVVHKNSETVYLSEANFSEIVRPISPPIPDIDLSASMDLPHDALILQPSTVLNCIQQNKLFSLISFYGLEQDEVMLNTIKNLECRRADPGEPVFRITCKSSRPEDAQTILNCLLDTHVAMIKQAQRLEIDNYERRLEELRDRAVRDLQKPGLGKTAEEKQAVLYRLKDVEKRMLDLELSGLPSSRIIKLPVEIRTIYGPTYGEIDSPSSILYLLFGTGLGFGFGSLMALLGIIFWW